MPPAAAAAAAVVGGDVVAAAAAAVPRSFSKWSDGEQPRNSETSERPDPEGTLRLFLADKQIQNNEPVGGTLPDDCNRPKVP